MILYDYDSNLILSNPIKTRQAAELTSSCKALFLKMQTNCHAPELHILDNEYSEELHKAFKRYQVTFQLVPLHVHLQNAAERVIQTWKNHFLAGIATLDPNFPIQEWDRLLPQCGIILNLLRFSRRQPNLPAYAATFGNFKFDLTPLALPGTHVLVHETNEQRASFAPHGVDGWYIGPSLDTLNLLRSSRRQPNISAYAATFGNFNFNQTPLAPPGTHVLVHKMTKQCSSFAPHGFDGWYIDPSLDHYQCYSCYIPSTAVTRDAI